METLVEGFAWALADYPMPKIIKAMRKYVLSNSDIPAPADIIKLIQNDAQAEYEPPIDTLVRYHDRGVPLSKAQKIRLASAKGIPFMESEIIE